MVCRFTGPAHAQCGQQKVLALAMVQGSIQLMASHLDPQPIILEAAMQVSCTAWSPGGDIFLVAGSLVMRNEDIETHALKFYSNTGYLLYQMPVPNTGTIHGQFSDKSSTALPITSLM